MATQNSPLPGSAVELYDGQLWRLRRAYAEASGSPWMIVSAEHGVIATDAVIATYDMTIDRMTRDRGRCQRWLDQVTAALAGIDEVEIHAGKPYIKALSLAVPGLFIRAPLAGLGLGHQKQWYKRRTTAA